MKSLLPKMKRERNIKFERENRKTGKKPPQTKPKITENFKAIFGNKAPVFTTREINLCSFENTKRLKDTPFEYP